MRILRGVCESDSYSDSVHRVKVTVQGVCSSEEVDVVNGVYLRKGDQVFVYYEDRYASPLVLGRCSGQVEVPELLNLINAMVDVFNGHVHTFTGDVVGKVCSGTTMASLSKQSKIKMNDILY